MFTPKNFILIELSKPENSETIVHLPKIKLLELLNGEQGISTIYPTVDPNIPLPLLFSGNMPENIIRTHNQRSHCGDIFLVLLNNVEIYSRCYCSYDNKIIYIADVYPEYYKNYLINFIPLGSNLDYKKLDVITLDQKPVCIISHFNTNTYGHFILEVLPKLFLLKLLCAAGFDFDLVISNETPNNYEQIIRLSIDPYKVNIIRFDPAKEFIRARSVLFPSMMSHNYHIHPVVVGVISDLIAKSIQAYPSRDLNTFIAISRLSRRQKRKDYRVLLNENDMLDKAEELGGYLVEPEKLSFLEQVRLFSQAKIIVGEYSSALHNAIFALTGTSVVSVNWINEVQSRIANFSRHELAYILPSDNIPRIHNEVQNSVCEYSVNIDELEKKLLYFLEK